MSWLSDLFKAPAKASATPSYYYEDPSGQTGGTLSSSPVNPTPPQPPPPPPSYTYTDPLTGVRSTTPENDYLLRGQTSRNLDLLRNTLTASQNRGVDVLRRNLAQRNMLDSGSMGAGVANIANQTGQRMAEGTMAAANNESDRLLQLTEAQRGRDFQMSLADKQLAWQREALRQQLAQQMQLANLQYENQPQWYDYLLGGAGNALGNMAGGWAARAASGSGSNTKS